MTNPIASSVVEKYWHVFEINTKGPLIAVQAFLRFASPDAIVIDVSPSKSIANHSMCRQPLDEADPSRVSQADALVILLQSAQTETKER